MKFTKRAYVKVWQNCPIDDREDTTIILLDYEDANELNSIPVTLLYLLERHAFVNSMNEFNILECCLTAESFDLIGFVKTYRDMPSKTGDFWTPMKFITASPKPMDGIPNNPDPLSCHNCGQRFKYVGQNQLAYKDQSNRADILRTLKLKAETQPTFDLAEINQ